ncbi:MAG: flippase [Patescibacteria group bacterium]
MSLSARVFQNTAIQIISKVIATILGLVAVAIMTRYLGRTGFGEYTTIITFLSFFGILIDFGLTLVTVQMISRPGVDEKKILDNLFGLRLTSAVIFLALAPLAIIFFPYSYDIKIGAAIAAFSFLFAALNQVFVGLFQIKLKMDKVSIAEVASRIVLVIGVLVAAKMDKGLLGIVSAMAFSSAASFFLHWIFSRRYVHVGIGFDWILWKEIIKKSWPLAVTIIFNLVYLKADTLILSLIKSQGDVGVYGAAYKVIDVLVTVPFMFAGIVLPILTINWVTGDEKSFKRVLQKSFDFMVILAVPLIVGTQFLAKEIMTLVAGQEFSDSGRILRILVLAAGAIFLGSMFSHAIIAVDKQKKIIGAYFFTSLTALAGYLIFIPRFSYIGAAWMTIYSEVIIALAAVYYTFKYSGFFPEFRVFLKSVLASAVMALFLFVLPARFCDNVSGLFFTLFFSAVVYFISLYLFKGITKDEISNLLKRQPRI